MNNCFMFLIFIQFLMWHEYVIGSIGITRSCNITKALVYTIHCLSNLQSCIRRIVLSNVKVRYGRLFIP